MRKRGFTLVELLVILGTTVLLLAILLPALSRVRSASRAGVCLSNHREVGLGSSLRANDSGGYLPLGGLADIQTNPVEPGSLRSQLSDRSGRRYAYAKSWSLSIWPEELVPFPLAVVSSLDPTTTQLISQGPFSQNRIAGIGRSLSLFHCPDVGLEDTQTLRIGWAYLQSAQVRVTQGYPIKTDWDIGVNLGVAGFDAGTVQGRPRGLVTRVKGPSQVALTVGIDRSIVPEGVSWQAFWQPITGVVNADVTLRDALENTGRERSGCAFDPTRHGRRVEVLFVDGHAALIPIEPDALSKVILRPQ